MTERDETDVPDSLSPETAAELDALDTAGIAQLQRYVQARLRADHGLDTEATTPDEGEVVAVEEHTGYTAVTLRHPCERGCESCPHGPYLYHVTREPHADDTETLHWSFIGRVKEE